MLLVLGRRLTIGLALSDRAAGGPGVASRLVVPAVVVGVAIVVLSQLFMFLVPRLVGVAASPGRSRRAFIALAWLSFTFQALLYRRGLGPGPRCGALRAEPRAEVSPGESRSAGRTGRWRTVTARS